MKRWNLTMVTAAVWIAALVVVLKDLCAYEKLKSEYFPGTIINNIVF